MSGIQTLPVGAFDPLGKTPTAIIGNNSTTASQSTYLQITASPTAVAATNFRTVLSGSLTANVYKDVVSISGAGVLNFVALSSENTTSKDMYIKITLDGTQVVEGINLAQATANTGIVVVGSATPSSTVATYSFTLDAVPFHTSCVISIKSSVTETDSLRIYYMARTV